MAKVETEAKLAARKQREAAELVKRKKALGKSVPRDICGISLWY